MMKSYLRIMVENCFTKNLAFLGYAGIDNAPVEALKRNSYTLLNVSPRFF